MRGELVIIVMAALAAIGSVASSIYGIRVRRRSRIEERSHKIAQVTFRTDNESESFDLSPEDVARLKKILKRRAIHGHAHVAQHAVP